MGVRGNYCIESEEVLTCSKHLFKEMAHNLKTVLWPLIFSFLLLDLAYFKTMPFRSQAKPNKRWQGGRLKTILSQEGGTVPFNSPLWALLTRHWSAHLHRTLSPRLKSIGEGGVHLVTHGQFVDIGLTSVTSAPSNVWYDLLASGLNIIWMFLDIIFNLRMVSWTYMIPIESDTWDLLSCLWSVTYSPPSPLGRTWEGTC